MTRRARPDPPGAGEGRRADGRRAPGHGEHGQAPPAVTGSLRPARHGRPAAAGACRPHGRADEQAVAAMRQAIGETAGTRPGRPGLCSGGPADPRGRGGETGRCRRTGRFTGCSARCRTAGSDRVGIDPPVAGRTPGGPFGQLPAAAPGDVVQIDSTPLDVLVRLDNGVPGRVELTGIIDVATRVVPAAVLRPTTKSVDASVLLARALTPEPIRPGWPEALQMADSALPYERMLDIDARLEHAAARPVIIPEMIVIDHGSVFVSASFQASCAHLGISIQPAHMATGADKATSSGCWDRSPRCSPSTCPAMPGAARNAAAGMSRRPAAVVHGRAAGPAGPVAHRLLYRLERPN